MLRAHRAIALRWATVTLAAISWLAVSNHCALGLAAIENHEATSVAEHDCCAREVPAQPNPAKDPAAPCCKTLQATTVTSANVFQANATMLAGAPLAFVRPIGPGAAATFDRRTRGFLIPDRRAEERMRSLSCNGACPRMLLLSRPNDLVARSREPLPGRCVKCARKALPSVCIQSARSTPIPFSMISNSSFRNNAALAAGVLAGCDSSLPPPQRARS